MAGPAIPFPRARVSFVVALLLSLVAPPVRAQHGGGAEPLATRAPAEATQFDFLVGQWDLTVMPQVAGLAGMIHGAPKMKGTWKAWRALEGWGIEDEMRIVDESGNPRALTHFLRVYDAAGRGWKVAAADAYRGVITTSNAKWTGAAMELSSGATATDADGKKYVTRTRITDITPTSLKYVQERSSDGGTKWEATLKIDAKRTAAVAPR
jgi:hypothetical protein